MTPADHKPAPRHSRVCLYASRVAHHTARLAPKTDEPAKDKCKEVRLPNAPSGRVRVRSGSTVSTRSSQAIPPIPSLPTRLAGPMTIPKADADPYPTRPTTPPAPLDLAVTALLHLGPVATSLQPATPRIPFIARAHPASTALWADRYQAADADK
ncbi:hypothetical protein FS749_008631, partial [Ceratobasidium sp. UAMH 11750]